MSDVKDFLKKHGKSITYKYYGINDLATGYDIKFILDNYKTITSLFQIANSKKTIQSMDDLRLFFLACKYAAMDDSIPYIINDEDKKTIKNLIARCKKYINLHPHHSITQYINLNYKDILKTRQPDRHQIIEAIFDYIIENCNDFDQSLWFHLAEKYDYIILSNYSRLLPIFKKPYGPHLLDITIHVDNYEQLSGYMLEASLGLLSKILKIKGNHLLEKAARKKVDEIYSVVINSPTSSNGRDLLVKTFVYHTVLAFLIEIKDGRANSFSDATIQLDKKANDELLEKGEHISYEIPLYDIMEEWQRPESWEVQLLSLTHTAKMVDGKVRVESRLQFHDNNKEMIDAIRSINPTDGFFTNSHQSHLQINAAVESSIIYTILQNKKTLPKYHGFIEGALSFIEEQSQSRYAKALVDDGKILFSGIEKILSNKDSQIILYGTSMFICSLSEKLLKTLVREVVGDSQYLPPNRLTLGTLLNPKHKDLKVVETFGEYHLKNISYFLQKTPGAIGENLRNNLAHLSDEIENNLSMQTITKLLWLFTDILNTVFWYYLEPTINKTK